MHAQVNLEWLVAYGQGFLLGSVELELFEVEL
jgi:hypothetical protein